MKFKHHKYTWSKPWGTAKHHWEVVGPQGAIHFHATGYTDHGYSCGLEMHQLRGSGAPDHVNCPLTGGRCWHDGTSLYADEYLWPLIEPYLKHNDHDTIFKILEEEYEKRFEGAQQ